VKKDAELAARDAERDRDRVMWKCQLNWNALQYIQHLYFYIFQTVSHFINQSVADRILIVL